MKHVLLLLASALSAVVGGAVLVSNLKTPTTPVLIFAGVFFLLAIALAVPTDFKAALTTAAPYIPGTEARRSRLTGARAAVTEAEVPEPRP